MDYDSKRHTLFSTNRLLMGWLCWLCMLPQLCYANPSPTDLSVWVNEAIVTTYTLTAENFLSRQKEIATYFTSQGWIDYTKAQQAAKLNDAIKKNNYAVSAVALLPPTIKSLHDKAEWQATMPLLVLYKNQDYQQKQTLSVTVTFIKTKSNAEGVRGLALSSFTATITAPPCPCDQAAQKPQKLKGWT